MKMTFLVLVPQMLADLFAKATQIDTHEAASKFASGGILLGPEGAIPTVREQLSLTPGCQLREPRRTDRECPIDGDTVVLFIHDENYQMVKQGLRILKISTADNNPLWTPMGDRNPTIHAPSPC